MKCMFQRVQNQFVGHQRASGSLLAGQVDGRSCNVQADQLARCDDCPLRLGDDPLADIAHVDHLIVLARQELVNDRHRQDPVDRLGKLQANFGIIRASTLHP